VKDVDLARQASSKRTFDLKDFRLCHKCLDIKMPDDNGDFICASRKIDADPTLRPFVFQNILLYSDFSAAPEVYHKKAISNSETSREYMYYGHPFFKTYTL
jgi:hypothetical protein